MYFLILPTGVAALVGGATEMVGGVDGGGEATEAVADDTSKNVVDFTGSKGSNFPVKGKMIAGVGSTSAESLVEVDFVWSGW